jgi:hypothetical protein
MRTIPVAELCHWQHSSPTGGLIQSTWTPRDLIEAGMGARVRAMWRAITAIRDSAVPGIKLAEFAAVEGEQSGRILAEHGGLECRTDMRVSLQVVA